MTPSYLCMSTELSSTDMAAWVQAIGSILAIAGAVGTAIWQMTRSQANAMKLERIRQHNSEIDLAKTIRELCKRSTALVTYTIGAIGDRQEVHELATGQKNYYDGDLEYLKTALASMPLHMLPSRFVKFPMFVRSQLGQMQLNIEAVLKNRDTLDAADLDAFGKSLNVTLRNLEAAYGEIDLEIQTAEASPIP
jgi:hypothetical protein